MGQRKRLLSKPSGHMIALSVGDSPMATSKRLRPVYSSLYVATNKGLHVASFGPKLGGCACDVGEPNRHERSAYFKAGEWIIEYECCGPERSFPS